MFQSLPGQRAGCKTISDTRALGPPLFRPSPSPLAGCKCALVVANNQLWLFQSSPSQRARCKSPSSRRCRRGPPGFNPHPAFWPGANSTRSTAWSATTSFNPHPTRWSGATHILRHVVAVVHVSILTQRAGRVQPQTTEPAPVSSVGFQSSPNALVGCNCSWCGEAIPYRCFNPHPTRWSGATGASR